MFEKAKWGVGMGVGWWGYWKAGEEDGRDCG